MPDYLILGCGYTAKRTLRPLLDSGSRVIVTNRESQSIPGVENIMLDVTSAASLAALKQHLSPGIVVLHSISTTEGMAELMDVLQPFRPARMLYISTTGVYGPAEIVDHTTLPLPDTERDRQRLATEQLVAAGPWSSLILRPAAIYGPGRGVHTSARDGVFRPPPGGNRIISRIHVEDLANQVVAGLHSDITGAFPIADDEPAPSIDVAEYACTIVGKPLRLEERESTARDERKKDRRVDGSAFRKQLGLTLRFASYRDGVPACLKDEGVIVAEA